MFFYLFFSCVVIILIFFLFFLVSKSEKWENINFSSFECGFSSYFFSRFSFSIHFFVVGMIFLFLDLEICLVMPYILGMFDNVILCLVMTLFIILLLSGLFMEWIESNIEWKF